MADLSGLASLTTTRAVNKMNKRQSQDAGQATFIAEYMQALRDHVQSLERRIESQDRRIEALEQRRE